MAELKEKFFGKISGAFGDFIGVVRGDDNYIVKKKANRKVDTSPEAIERRNKFGVAIKASKVVNAVPNLKSIWVENAPSKLTAFNSFIKYNYKYVDGSGSKPGFSLLPGIGFAFSVDTFNQSESDITITLLPLANSTTFDTGIEKNIEAHFLLELFNPNESSNNKILFFSKSSVSQALVLDNPLTFSVNLLETEANLLASYPNVKVHVVFCTLDESNNPIQYSSTYTQ